MTDKVGGAVSVEEYASRLVGYLQHVYQDIYRRQSSDREEIELEQRAQGAISAELSVGDVVAVKLPPTQSRKGPKRFTERTREQLWRVYKKIGPNTFGLEDANDPSYKNPYTHNAENLIKINLPSLEAETTKSQYVELYSHDTAEWTRYRILRHSIDGRTLIRQVTRDDEESEWVEHAETRWVDMAGEVYRWIV